MTRILNIITGSNGGRPRCPPSEKARALAPIDLLAGVVTARTAGFRCLDALAVDNRSRGTGFASNAFAVRHDKSVIDPLEDAGVAPGREPAIDRAPWRQVGGNKPPRAARTHHIEDRVDDLAQRPASRPSSRPWPRKKRFDHTPFLVGDVALVT